MNVAHADFQATVEKLWSRLGLASPRFTEPGRLQLRVEGISLDLVDNGRGALIVEGGAGTLAADPAARARQIRRVLQTNLGFLVSGEAGVYFAGVGEGQVAVTVHARYSYGTASLERLIKKIEDVVEMVEYYSSEMKSNAASGACPETGMSAASGPAVIFRP